MKPLLSDISVNGEVIAAAQIAAEAQNHPAPKEKPGLAWKAAARALAVRALLLQEARARGLTPAPEELAPGQWETEEEALVRQLLDTAVQPEAVSEETLRAAYAEEPERFRAPTLYEAAHILIPAAPDDPQARAEAGERAAGVLAEAIAAPRRFAELARQFSACSSRDSGGLLGQLSTGDTVPEFEAALDAAEEGQIAPEPVQTRFGFHILRLDARARGNVLPYEAAEPALRAAHEKAAWIQASRTLIETLVARAEIVGIALKAA